MTAGWSTAIAREWATVSAAIVAATVTLGLAFSQGGYFLDSVERWGSVTMAAVAVLVGLGPRRARLSAPALVALASFAGLAAWTGIAASWSIAPDTAAEEFRRMVFYVGFLGLAVVACGSGRGSRRFVWLVLGVLGAITLAGLGSRLFPGEIATPADITSFSYRLAWPVGYWNALGVISAMASVLALGLAADREQAPVLRGAAAGLCVLAVTTLYLTLSRGSWLALFVGVAVLFAVSPRRRAALVTLLLIGGACALALGLLSHYDSLTDAADLGLGQTLEGQDFATQLLLIALATAGLQWSLAHAGRDERLPRIGSRAAAIVLGAAVVAGLVVYAAAPSKSEGLGARSLDHVTTFVSRSWTDFMAASASGTGSERLSSAKGTRSDLYRVAIAQWKAHPLRGEGPGAFEYRFMRERRVDEKVRNAHSAYLQTLGEQGLVGFLLLMAFIGGTCVAGVRSALRSGAVPRGLAAATVAAFAVFAAHIGVDFDLEVPVVPACGLLLAASLLPRGRRLSTRGRFRLLSRAAQGRGRTARSSAG